VRAVVAEAPYDDYRGTMARHARLYYGLPPWFPLIPAAIAVAEFRAGFDADEVSAVEAARRVRGALFLIVDEDDERMPEAVVRRVFDAHHGRSGSGRRRARPIGRRQRPGLLGRGGWPPRGQRALSRRFS
jgi:hypothetical protein